MCPPLPMTAEAPAATPSALLVLLVPQRLRCRDAGGLAGGDPCHRERRHVRDDGEDKYLNPGHVIGRVLRELTARDQGVGQENRQRYSREDRKQRHKGRFHEEAERHRASLVADSAEHADVLPPFDDGAERDYSYGGDADEEAEAHEALHQAEEVAEEGPLLLSQLLQRVGLDAGGEQRRLYLLRYVSRCVRIGQTDVVHGKLRLAKYGPKCLVRDVKADEVTARSQR